MTQLRILILLFAFLGIKPQDLRGQSIPVGSPVLEDYLRRQQLLGAVDPSYSFLVRPVFPRQAFGTENPSLKNTYFDQEILTGDSLEKFVMLPISLKSQYNSNHAFGVNDGALIPNAGIQALLSGGIYYEYGKWSVQFQPEILMAQNRDYEGFPLKHDGSTWIEYYEWLNFSDIPERFGTSGYTILLPGQSSIRYNTGPVSLGVSTENIWWGPGRRNSLIMGNNAPGFLHATVNTQAPFETPIGAFEGQLLAGQLQNSGFDPPASDYVYRQTPLFVPKRDGDWRYLAGLVISYQPKWVPGLSLGYSSVSQMYHNDMHRMADYLPVFNGGKRSASVLDMDVARRNQLSSGFFRWMDPEGRLEFYAEYGSNGNSRTINDFLVNPDLTRAFTLGFMHLIPIKQPGQFIQVGGEITQTGQTVRETILKKNSWYTHPHVRHGYTHRGQVLGAGIGPGSNVIFLEAAWTKDFNKIGFQIERLVHNNDFYYKRFEDIKDWRVKYVDIVPTVLVDWKFDNILLASKIQYVHSLNYNWYIVNMPDQYWVPGYDKTNLVIHLGATYRFQ